MFQINHIARSLPINNLLIKHLVKHLFICLHIRTNISVIRILYIRMIDKKWPVMFWLNCKITVAHTKCKYFITQNRWARISGKLSADFWIYKHVIHKIYFLFFTTTCIYKWYIVKSKCWNSKMVHYVHRLYYVLQQ